MSMEMCVKRLSEWLVFVHRKKKRQERFGDVKAKTAAAPAAHVDPAAQAKLDARALRFAGAPAVATA